MTEVEIVITIVGLLILTGLVLGEIIYRVMDWSDEK